jgi:hypothetical protein
MSRKETINRLRQIILYNDYPCELTRSVHAQAIRYTVHPRYRDTDAPLSDFDHDPQVAQYKTAFNNFKSADMFAKGEKQALLRSMVSFGKGLSNPRLKAHRRKSRANEIMRITRRLLRDFCREDKSLRGLFIFTTPIAREYTRN